MRKLLRAAAAAAVATVASGALVLGFAGAAAAAGNPPWEPDPNSVGGLIFYNAAGQQITGGNLTDSPIAAYVQGTATIQAGDTKATLYGYLPVDGETPAQWSGEPLGSSTTYPNSSAPGALATSTLPLETGSSSDDSIANLESDYPNKDTSTDGYADLYQLRLKTSESGVGALATYDSADIEVDATTGTWSVVYPVPSLTSTTTTLSTSPSSPQVSGTSVTLTATVSPAAPGTVQFESNGTDVGSPVTLSGGVASLSTTSLAVGTDDLSAVYTPQEFSAYATSTGTASFTISPPPAAPTTTALGVNPSSAAADTSVSITATITETSDSSALASGTGEVQFYDDGTDTSGDITSNSQLLGTVPVGTGGIASLSWASFATGAHNLVAEFLPSDTSVYDASTSLPVLFTATAPVAAPAPQDVQVNIPAGTLTITTPYSVSNPFSLGNAALNTADSAFVASAPFGSSTNPAQGVTITDTRAGDLGWTASATVTDFSDGNGDVINGQNLTFTDVTPSYVTGDALQAGSVTTYDVTNTAVYAPTATGSDGLKGGPHEFASAAAGDSDGSVYVYGLLTLTAPSSSVAGTYTATLTFTVI